MKLRLKIIMSIACMAAALLCSMQSAAQGTSNHGIPWNVLAALDGKYPSDAAPRAVLDPPLRKLLKGKYKEFIDYYGVQTPMAVDDGVLLSSGMKAHSGGDHAAFALYGMKGELLVAIKRNGKLDYAGDRQLLKKPVVVDYLKTYD